MAKAIVGLGNPGDKYAGTRHNIGFMVIDRLADKLGLSFTDKFDGSLAVKDIEGERIYFLKPMTFMNLSGASVGALARFYKIAPEDIFVIHDEMNIPYGKMKIRRDGSAGGHNGLASIIEHLGSNKFPRLKMGIDRKSGEDTIGHVLGRFAPAEKEGLEDFLERGTNAVMKVITDGADKAMTEYNR